MTFAETHATSPNVDCGNTTPRVTMPWSVIHQVWANTPIASRPSGNRVAATAQATTSQARSSISGNCVSDSSMPIANTCAVTNGPVTCANIVTAISWRVTMNHAGTGRTRQLTYDVVTSAPSAEVTATSIVMLSTPNSARPKMTRNVSRNGVIAR